MTKITKAFKGIFSITTLIVCFALCLTLAELLSNVITIKAFNNTNSSGKATAYNIYAIYLHESATETTANEYSTTIKKQGGAGFVWLQNEKYYVLASAYSNENDAKLVQNNLIGSEIDAKILTIQIPEISIKGNYTSLETTALIDAINSFKLAYDTLYDISISLDTNIKNESECKLLVGDLKSSINKIEITYNSVFNTQLTTNILYLKIAINSLCNKLNEMVNYDTSDFPYTYKLKNTYIYSLQLNYELCKNINEIK